MSDQVQLEDLPEAEINKKIVEITIKIGEQEVMKKQDAKAHKDVIDDLTTERDELVDEVLRRRR